jgi:hypothetical protein
LFYPPLCLDYQIYVQTKEPTDYHLLKVTYLEETLAITEHDFSKFPPFSVVILDDFSFKKANNKQEKTDFLRVINYTLRHHNITLILVVHNMYNTNLSNEILLAPHLFLSYSNLGHSIIR